MSLRFEWDDAKNQSNILNHHISFLTASEVFYDDNRIELYDGRHDEDRWITIGSIGMIVYVVYTVRENDVIRIISAREAIKSEKEAYYDNNL